MNELHKETPLSKAIFELLHEIKEITEATQQGLPAGAIRAFIFGGCAVHIYTNARGSNDLDVELESVKGLDLNSIIIQVEPVEYIDESGRTRELYFDNNFNPAIPDLHPDWRESSIALQLGESTIHIYLVSAVDIAVSKLGRCTPDDVNDILSLYQSKQFTLDEFKTRAQEALEYSPTPDRLQSNIEFAIQELSETKQ